MGNSFKVVRRGAKRSRVSVVPEVLTFRADEVCCGTFQCNLRSSIDSPCQSSITIEEIDGVHDFVEKLEKIALPNQLISAIDDPLLRKYVVLRGNDLPAQRIDDWLSLFFDTQLKLQEHSEGLGKPLTEVLEKSLNHAYYTKVRSRGGDRCQKFSDILKVIPSSVQSFLAAFLDRWDGMESRALVLDLLAYLPLQDFEGK